MDDDDDSGDNGEDDGDDGDDDGDDDDGEGNDDAMTKTRTFTMPLIDDSY